MRLLLAVVLMLVATTADAARGRWFGSRQATYNFVATDGVLTSGCCSNANCPMLQSAQAAVNRGDSYVRIGGVNHPIKYLTTRPTVAARPVAPPVQSVPAATTSSGAMSLVKVQVERTKMVQIKTGCINGRCTFRNVPVTEKVWVDQWVPVATKSVASPQIATKSVAAKDEIIDITLDFAPTPEGDAKMMVTLAQIGPDDVVYDLGCGDGRILEYASPYALMCIGVESNPETFKMAVERTCDLKNVQIMERDIEDTNASDGDVVFLFHYPGTPMMERLTDRLKHLRPGARIVSYLHNHFDGIDGFETESYKTPGDSEIFVTTVVPAAVPTTFNLASQLAAK